MSCSCRIQQFPRNFLCWQAPGCFQIYSFKSMYYINLVCNSYTNDLAYFGRKNKSLFFKNRRRSNLFDPPGPFSRPTTASPQSCSQPPFTNHPSKGRAQLEPNNNSNNTRRGISCSTLRMPRRMRHRRQSMSITTSFNILLRKYSCLLPTAKDLVIISNNYFSCSCFCCSYSGAGTIKNYRFVIYGKWTDFAVRQCLFY